MIGYICTDNRNIKDNIKYEIGKRYKIETEENFIFYERSINYFNDILICDKIYKIKVYDSSNNNGTRNFKILCEINYKNLLNLKNKNEQILSAIKNKEESVLDKLIHNDKCNDIMAVIKSGVHKYLDKIAKSENEFMIAFLIKLKGRNKDLDNFINCNNDEIKCRIANVGRPQDLDILINSRNFYSIHSVLKNGRSKDINEYIEDIEDIEDCFHCSSIIKTGIDKYLDKFVNNKIYCPFLISEQGRKCDLDILVHDEDEDIRKAVVYHGYDDHLDILEKENNYNINQIIDELRGKRDL